MMTVPSEKVAIEIAAAIDHMAAILVVGFDSCLCGPSAQCSGGPKAMSGGARRCCRRGTDRANVRNFEFVVVSFRGAMLIIEPS
jgi:hypothetical protein